MADFTLLNGRNHHNIVKIKKQKRKKEKEVGVCVRVCVCVCKKEKTVTITREEGAALLFVSGSTLFSPSRNTTFISSITQESLSAKNMSQTDVSPETSDLGVKHHHPNENRQSCLFRACYRKALRHHRVWQRPRIS